MADKIYSATQFFNELDLLELRLETLGPVVDYFVISESTKTHSGKDKPLYYRENKNRFKKFHDKIIHQVIDHTPKDYNEVLDIYDKAVKIGSYASASINVCKKIIDADWFDKRVDSYIRDTFEKEALLYPIFERSSSTDIILLGDLDEIPRPERVEKAASLLFGNGRYGLKDVYHFQHDMFYYYLNVEKNEPWHGTLITTVGKFKEDGFCKLRTYKPGYKIKNGGWHFTYMGGLDKVKKKIHSWGEQSLNTATVNNNLQNNFENFIELGRDLFFRPAQWKIRDINDGTFPQYLVDHQDDIFEKYIYKK